MEKKTLQMIFKTTEGANLTVNLGDLKEDLTDSEVATVMDEIVANQLFASNKGPVVAKNKAQIVTQSVAELAV